MWGTMLYFLAALALLLHSPALVAAACTCTGKNTGLDTASVGLPAEWGTGCKAWVRSIGKADTEWVGIV